MANCTANLSLYYSFFQKNLPSVSPLREGFSRVKNYNLFENFWFWFCATFTKNDLGGKRVNI
jgi:hypothetical protein